MSEINLHAGTTGNDPVLDALRVRLHTETTCRTGTAIVPQSRDLNPRHLTYQWPAPVPATASRSSLPYQFKR